MREVMLPCGRNHYRYDPYKQYCKMDGQIGWCDPSFCLLPDTEWERRACSFYCGDNNEVNYPTVQEDGTSVWKVLTWVLVAIVCVIIGGVIAYFCKNNKNTTTPGTKSSTKPKEKADPEETKIFIDDNNVSSKSESDSAVGSYTSQSTEKYSMIPPQNNHDDPHTRRESSAAIAITSGTEEVRRPIDFQEGETDRKEWSSGNIPFS